jgi:RHS repeat-associated protein
MEQASSEQASSAFSTGVPALAAIPQLAGNSRQGFGVVASTSRWGSGFSISSNTLGLSTSLYDGDAGSRSTGKERDAESGNDYFEARYYSGAMGRFLSPDFSEDPEPIPYSDKHDPQTLNLYSYVLNNPLSHTDPDGHWCVLGIGSTCAKPPDPCGSTPNCVSVTAKPDPPSHPWNPHTDPPRNWAQRSILPAVNFLDQHPWINAIIGPNCPNPSDCVVNDSMPWGPTGGLGTAIDLSIKPLVGDVGLQGILDQLYKAGDTILGGTAGAAGQELATGINVGGKSHFVKAVQMARRLEKGIQSGKWSGRDLDVARAVMNNLRDAVTVK